MRIKDIIKEYIDTKDYTSFENTVTDGSFSKMEYSDFESLLCDLLSTSKSEWVRLLNAYYSKIVSKNSSLQFLHIVMPKLVTGSSRDLIQNYKFINMYNNFIDCSRLLEYWSPTESYFPVLIFIERSKPEKPIDYTYWLRRFNDLPIAIKFLKGNNIKIEFTNASDLVYLYRTIPQKYIKDFINLLGNKSWYMDTIKDTDHFLEEVEDI